MNWVITIIYNTVLRSRLGLWLTYFKFINKKQTRESRAFFKDHSYPLKAAPTYSAHTALPQHFDRDTCHHDAFGIEVTFLRMGWRGQHCGWLWCPEVTSMPSCFESLAEIKGPHSTSASRPPGQWTPEPTWSKCFAKCKSTNKTLATTTPGPRKKVTYMPNWPWWLGVLMEVSMWHGIAL